MRKVVLVVVAVLIVVVFFAGFWPQHRQLTASQDQARSLQERLTTAEGKVRLGEVLGQLLRLSDAVRMKNYGEAATLSSSFFDAVRQEASRSDRPEVTNVLNGILQTRDRVTTAIASADAGIDQVLQQQEEALRRALGYPTSGPS